MLNIKTLKQKLFILSFALFAAICWHYATAEDFESATSTPSDAIITDNADNNQQSTTDSQQLTTENEEGAVSATTSPSGEDISPLSGEAKHDILPQDSSSNAEDEYGLSGEVRDSGESSEISDLGPDTTNATNSPANPEIGGENTNPENGDSETETTAEDTLPDDSPLENPPDSAPTPLGDLIEGGVLLSKKISVSAIECNDKFITFIIYKNGVDWTKNPEKYSFNKAFECLFPIILDIQEIKTGNYTLLKAEEGENEAWYNPQILTGFSIP